MWTLPRHQRLWEQILPILHHEDLAHDWLHVERVTKWSIKLARSIGENEDLAGAAGMLHDIINIPKESDLRSLGSELSAQAGIEHLKIADYTEAEINIVAEAIATCSWSKGASYTNAIGMILQDADRLDAIGAIGIMRNMACAQAMRSRGNPGQFYNSNEPVAWVENSSLNDKHYALDHFAKKLLRLREGMHTELAKREATQRHQFMVSFLEQVEQEVWKC